MPTPKHTTQKSTTPTTLRAARPLSRLNQHIAALQSPNSQTAAAAPATPALSKDELQSTREAQQKNAFLLQENMTLTTALNTQNTQIENLNTKLIALELKLEAEKKQSAELKEGDEKSKKIICESTTAIERMKTQIAELESSKKALTQQSTEQQTKIAKYEAQLKLNASQAADLQKRIPELEASIKQLEQSSETMKMKLAELETEKAALTKQITEQQTTIAEYEVQLKLNASQHEELQKIIIQLETDLHTKTTEQAVITGVGKKSDAKHEETIQKLSKELEQARNETLQQRSTITELLTRNAQLNNQVNSLQSNLKTAIDQSKQKNHWGWYALGVVGVLVGLALTATGFGAIAGAPLALTILGGMFATTLATSFSAIMVGLSTSIVGLAGSIASGAYINRKVKHDKVCDEAIENCAAKVKKPIAVAPVIATPAVTTSSAGQSTQPKLLGMEHGRGKVQSPLPDTDENRRGTDLATQGTQHPSSAGRRGFFGPATTVSPAAPAATASAALSITPARK